MSWLQGSGSRSTNPRTRDEGWLGAADDQRIKAAPLAQDAALSEQVLEDLSSTNTIQKHVGICQHERPSNEPQVVACIDA